MKSNSVWSTKYGIRFRWFIFIPFSVVTYYFAEFIAIYSIKSMISATAPFQIFPFVILAFVAILFMSCLVMLGSLTSPMCPDRKAGSIILTVIVVGSWFLTYHLNMPDHTTTWLISKIICCVLYLFGAWFSDYSSY